MRVEGFDCEDFADASRGGIEYSIESSICRTLSLVVTETFYAEAR